MKRLVMGGVVTLVGMTAVAGGWNFSAGPSWRAAMTSEISGVVPVATPAASQKAGYNRNVPGKSDWSSADIASGAVVEKGDPDYPGLGLTKWAAVANWTETTVMPGATAARLSSSDDNSQLGLRLNGGYDWNLGSSFSLGVNVLFAGYWKMESSATGYAAGGSETTTQWSDYYLFSGGVVPPDIDLSGMSPEASPYLPYRDNYSVTTRALGGQRVSARIRSDLYQIGLGPKVTWHALPWLDAYANVNALCNIANMNLSTSSGSTSEVQCRFGIGADVGLAAHVTDWFGLYADVGYEWVDKASTSCGDVTADVDFSSLVVSAGVVFQF